MKETCLKQADILLQLVRWQGFTVSLGTIAVLDLSVKTIHFPAFNSQTKLYLWVNVHEFSRSAANLFSVL